MAEYTLDKLLSDLQRGTYTPKTEQELQGIADRRYQSYYDQQRLGATQAAESTGLALDQQLKQLGQQYGKQREQSAQNYAQAYSQTGNTMLQRGMQRSSYGAQTQANIALAGNKAQQEISSNEQMANQNIGEQQTLLAQQLAQQLRQYSASQAADTLAYIDELEAREYDRGTTSQDRSNSLAMQIYQFANQEKQQNQEQQNWLAQFNESVRQYNETAAKSTGSGRGGTGDDKPPADTPPAGPGSGLFDDLNKYKPVDMLVNSRTGNSFLSENIAKSGIKTVPITTNPISSQTAALQKQIDKFRIGLPAKPVVTKANTGR